jgi:hypothetical protein
VTRLAKADWLVTKSWNRLHHVNLSHSDYTDLMDQGYLDGPVRLACGRSAAWVSIPGVLTRLGASRCTGCCRATGLPPGVGSPKNDDACRAILGMGP